MDFALSRLAKRIGALPAFLVALLILCAATEILAAGATSPGPTAQSSAIRTERTTTRLLSSLATVGPGDRFLVALEQVFDPGWHSYWKNPGDSGFPATLTWRLPEGATAGPVLWPTPERQRFGTLTNYGHSGRLMLLAEIAAPRDLVPGASVEIGLAASWLVCADICIPEEAVLTLVLPAGAGGVPGQDAGRIRAAADALPATHPWSDTRFARDGDRLLLRVEGGGLPSAPIADVYFFPVAAELIDHAAAQRHATDAQGLTIEIPLAAGARKVPLDRLEGVLAIAGRAGGNTGANAYLISAEAGAVAPPPRTAETAASVTLLQALLLALAGGALLNLMPCVFPVLSMKALALASLPPQDRSARRREGAAYALGVLLCFAAIAGLMVALRAAGGELGWGFQFQSPGFVACMALLMAAVGLNLSGVFDLRAIAMTLPARLHAGGGAAFLTGTLAVLVATPCTAPFMAVALGMALAAEPAQMVGVVMALGVGFAMPFALIAFLPGLGAALPRPGPWMGRLRAILAFPMYATAAWLVWVLSQQVDAAGFAIGLASLVALAFAAWLTGVAGDRGPARAFGAAVALAAFVAAATLGAGSGTLGGGPRPPAPMAGSEPVAEPYSAMRLAALRSEGRAVFVNMTAAWCITCLFNEANALAAPQTRRLFAERGVVYLKGDWTRRDPAISEYLRQHARSGVPLYVAYPAAGGAPEILPQLLDPDTIRRAFGG
jgi:thiol:disulfide interchange protein DsbD